MAARFAEPLVSAVRAASGHINEVELHLQVRIGRAACSLRVCQHDGPIWCNPAVCTRRLCDRCSRLPHGPSVRRQTAAVSRRRLGILVAGELVVDSCYGFGVFTGFETRHHACFLHNPLALCTSHTRTYTSARLPNDGHTGRVCSCVHQSHACNTPRHVPVCLTLSVHATCLLPTRSADALSLCRPDRLHRPATPRPSGTGAVSRSALLALPRRVSLPQRSLLLTWTGHCEADSHTHRRARPG